MRLLAAVLLFLPALAMGAEPDYAAWDDLLARYYDPGKGMNYAALKARDGGRLRELRARLGAVNPSALSRDEQLAYWINLYNVNAVGIVVDHYPVESIRDISTDPIRRLNVFEKASVPFAGGKISLDTIEHRKIRDGFKDPRIHFVINCAAVSCPPMPARAVRGASLQQTLDQQTRQFFRNARIDRYGGNATIHVTKILDWFKDDFETWGGGTVNFLRKHLPPGKQKLLAGKVRLVYDDYDWTLNDRVRSD